MPQIEWHNAIELVRPFIFRIFTPRGSGTGFVVSKSDKVVGVATAWHVIEHAYTWGEPIKLQHDTSGDIFFLNAIDRWIVRHELQDIAVIIFNLGDLVISNPVPALIESKSIIKVGVEIGWLGFPSVSSGELCFFSGRVSSTFDKESAYLVDGVAINGVSGGPAFCRRGDNKIQYMGVVSAYRPNRSTGESLPGLAVVQDVAEFHDIVSHLNSVKEAKDQAEAKEIEVAPDSIDSSGSI